MSFSSVAFFAGHAKECLLGGGAEREIERVCGSRSGSGWAWLADCDSCAAAGQCRCECASSLIMTLITLRPRPPLPTPRPLTNSPSVCLSVHLSVCLSVRPSVSLSVSGCLEQCEIKNCNKLQAKRQINYKIERAREKMEKRNNKRMQKVAM